MMRFTYFTLFLAAVVAAFPAKNGNNNNNDNSANNNNQNVDNADLLAASRRGVNRNDAHSRALIDDLQNTFNRNNPNGTPAAPGDPADLNGDGVINAFEANAQVL